MLGSAMNDPQRGCYPWESNSVQTHNQALGTDINGLGKGCMNDKLKVMVHKHSHNVLAKPSATLTLAR